MKKSELKEYIRETIISELTPQDQAANNAAKAAIDDTVKDLTTKSAQTTDPEDKKAALAALTAAKAKQIGINKVYYELKLKHVCVIKHLSAESFKFSKKYGRKD